ncbi:hypothetical protein MBLNU457_4897t1 [Dothideomycetes sp. NU457]
MPATIDPSDCAGNEPEVMDSLNWTCCEGCDEPLLAIDLEGHTAACSHYARRCYARREYGRYSTDLEERRWIEWYLNDPSRLAEYKLQRSPSWPDRTPVCIWQPGIIIDMAADLPGDAPGKRRPWMVLDVDWSSDTVLACPLFTKRQRGLAFVPRDERDWYMPLAFTSHTLRFVATNQYREAQRQYGTDPPWPDHDDRGMSRYAPVVVEHAYAQAYLHATSMLAPRHAQMAGMQFIDTPFAVGRLAYHDFLCVLALLWDETLWRPNAPELPWL